MVCKKTLVVSKVENQCVKGKKTHEHQNDCKFFAGKTLVIPGYQRDYAWKERNVDDLFSDTEEALEVGGGHYLGTFILSQQDNNKAAPMYVVTGQQRLLQQKPESGACAGWVIHARTLTNTTPF